MKPNLKLSLMGAICAALLGAASIVAADDMAGMDMSSGSGESSDSGAMGGMGKHMMMGDHMTMTPLRPETAADVQRGEEIIATMRRVLTKYQDSDAAIAAGYIPYMPTVPQDVYHFASREFTADEYAGDINIEHPGAMLYEKKTLGGYKLVGAMYSAPANYTLDQLNAIIPLGLAHWHAHTNICLPNGVTEQDIMNGNIQGHATASTYNRPMGFSAASSAGARMRFGYMADPRFGFTGTISTESDCEAVGGNFHPQIFGWMVHVYPFASDDLKVAFSTEAP
ncbi:MAG: hypothetical protein ACLQAT_01260 [Candidatus Binataceae bacterium]